MRIGDLQVGDIIWETESGLLKGGLVLNSRHYICETNRLDLPAHDLDISYLRVVRCPLLTKLFPGSPL
jgi:hypothetical protein